MKLRHQIAGGLIVIGSLGVVGSLGAGTALAAQNPERAGHPSADYVCAHQDEAAAKLQTRIDKITAGLSKLAERRATATEAGNDRVVARIDKLVTRLNNRLAKAQQHLDNLPGWIADNC